MKGLIDVEAERSRLLKQKEKVEGDLNRSTAKLANEKFVNNAPPEVVTQEKERVSEFQKVIGQLGEQLDKLNELA